MSGKTSFTPSYREKSHYPVKDILHSFLQRKISLPRDIFSYRVTQPMIDDLGSRVGAVVKALASHQCGPGSIPGLDVICGLSLLLVLYSAPRGFSPGTPVFPSPQKPTFPNSNSIRMQGLPENHFAVSGDSWVNIMIYYFLLLLFI